MSALCRRFGVSRKTGYKWLARHRGEGGVAERVAPTPSEPVADIGADGGHGAGAAG